VLSAVPVVYALCADAADIAPIKNVIAKTILLTVISQSSGLCGLSGRFCSDTRLGYLRDIAVTYPGFANRRSYQSVNYKRNGRDKRKPKNQILRSRFLPFHAKPTKVNQVV
jgi:hypothetical protein